MEASEVSKSPVLIRYADVETLLFSVKQFPISDDEDQPLHFNIRMIIDSYSAEEGMLPILVDITFTEAAEKENPFVRAVILHKFQIRGMERFRKEEGRYAISNELLSLLANNAYSTTRGILVGRGAGTAAAALVLPIVGSEYLIQRFKGSDESNIILPEESGDNSE